jgi:hypothetical protein
MSQGTALGRDRRSTAGRRMTALIGKASEDDEAFWSHSTWKEDVDLEGQTIDQQEDASFHESDEDENDRVDAFDSDFDDTESEGCDEEMFDDDAELEAHREEVKMSKKNKVLDMVRAGRISALKKKNTVGKKSVRMGEGLNAGIRLKAPGHHTFTAQHVQNSTGLIGNSTVDPSTIHRNPSVASLKPQTTVRETIPNPISPRSRKRSLRHKQEEMGGQSRQSSNPPLLTKKTHKPVFTQEDLLLEAIHHTEPENMRWILARQRYMEDSKALELQKKMLSDEASAANRKVISRFHSKRGCYTSLTFPDMDHVPLILVKNLQTPNMVKGKIDDKERNVCVITGKLGRYRDPKTGKKFHDVSAFKELRRRLEAGEPLCSYM